MCLCIIKKLFICFLISVLVGWQEWCLIWYSLKLFLSNPQRFFFIDLPETELTRRVGQVSSMMVWWCLLVVSDEDILIEDLHPTTSYVFQVRARNEVGVGLQKRVTIATDDVRKFFYCWLTAVGVTVPLLCLLMLLQELKVCMFLRNLLVLEYVF